MCRKLVCLACLVFVLALANTATADIFMEWWTDIPDGDLPNLLNDPDYPDNPHGSGYLTAFEVVEGSIAELVDNYAVRVRGYFHPPVSGDYTFWIISDDEGRLFLSPKGGASYAVRIAQTIRSAPFDNWTRYAGQRSKPVTLEAGKKYYIEAIYAEGTGGDHLRIAYGPPGAQTIIPGSELSPYDPSIATNPSPADGDTLGQDSTPLSWSAGPGAAKHDVYFGTNPTPGSAEFVRRQPGTSLLVGLPNNPFPDGLTAGVTYYWRVDEVEADDTTLHIGEVWSFTVAGPTASNPVPADGARWVDPGVELSWTAGLGANIHQLYFGTDQTEVANGTGDTDKGMLGSTTYSPGDLEDGTSYYWRVDESSDGVTWEEGDVWRFRTVPVFDILDPNLVGWWKLEDEGTGTAVDYSGYGRHGTIHGDPLWVYGVDGDALEFYDRMDEEYVTIDGYTGVLGSHAFSITAWIRTRDNGEIVGWGNPSNGQRVEFRTNGDRLRCENGGSTRYVEGDTQVDDDEWHHVAVTVIDGATPTYPGDVTLYLDGQNDTRESSNGTAFNITANYPVTIAKRYNATGRFYWGAIDDVRIYDKVLTQEEIQEIMLRPDPYSAWAPSLADGSTTDIEQATPFTWSPGDLVDKHDVYLGTDEFTVDGADTSTTGIYRGRQDANSYTPTEALEYDQTYYWRIDQYNTNGTISRGKVWSFTVGNFLIIDDFEPYDDFCNRIFYTWSDGWGYSGDTACGVEPYSGNGTGSTVGYTSDPYAEQVIVSSGNQSMPFEYLNDGSDGRALYSETQRVFETAQDWTRHGVRALTLFFRGNPPSMSTFVEAPPGTFTLTTRSGDIGGSADSFHFVCKRLSGTGKIEVKIESMTNTSSSAKAGVMIRDTLESGSVNAFAFFRPDGGVRFSRRTEANSSTSDFDPGGTFTPPHWLRVERAGGNSVRAWHSTDGSNWEQLDEPQIIAMGADLYVGLALCSNNVNAMIEATFSDLITEGNVTGTWESVEVGLASNTPDQLYVAVEDSAGQVEDVPHPDPNAVLLNTWQQWNIPLSDFSDAGVNLQSIKKMYIGVGDRDAPTLGGTGLMYVDDILLYRPRCVPDIIKPAGDFNNDCTVGYPDLEMLADNWLRTVWDPTGGHDGSGSLVFGPTGDYVAIEDLFYSTPGHTAISVSSWIRTNSGANQYIISFDRNEYYRLAINSQSAAGEGQVGWHVATDAGILDSGSVTRVDDDQWHHVVGVFDAGTATIYIDGIAEPSMTLGTTYGSGETRYGFLCANSEAPAFDDPTPVAYPIQRLDDVRVYDYALSAADVTGLAQGTADPATGPILWYKLDETTGSVAADSSGNGYDGHLMFSWFETNLHDDTRIDFKDYAILVDSWLDEMRWP